MNKRQEVIKNIEQVAQRLGVAVEPGAFDKTTTGNLKLIYIRLTIQTSRLN
jgi:hypothetical protein